MKCNMNENSLFIYLLAGWIVLSFALLAMAIYSWRQIKKSSMSKKQILRDFIIAAIILFSVIYLAKYL